MKKNLMKNNLISLKTANGDSKKNKNSFVLYYIIFMNLIFLTPFLSRNLPNLVPLFFIIIWFLFLFFSNKKFEKRFNTFIFITFIWIAVEIFYKLVGFSSASFGNYLYRAIFFLNIINMFYISYYFKIDEKRKLAYSIIFIMIINLIDNIRLNILFPNASKEINFIYGRQFLDMNVGTTMFIATTMFFLGIMLIIYLKNKNIFLKLFSLLSIFASGYYIFLTQRATVIILTLIMVSLIIFFNLRIIKKRSLFQSFIFLLLVIIFFSSLIPIFEFFISLSTSENLISRYQSIIDLLTGELEISSDNSSFAVRLKLMELSFNSFSKNFRTIIFGIGDHRFIQGGSGFETGIGSHSEFIDTLARYGLIGLFFISNIMLISIRFIKNYMEKYNYKDYSLIIIIIFLIYSILNNSFQPEIGVMIFVFLPLIPFINRYEGDKKYE